MRQGGWRGVCRRSSAVAIAFAILIGSASGAPATELPPKMDDEVRLASLVAHWFEWLAAPEHADRGAADPLAGSPLAFAWVPTGDSRARGLAGWLAALRSPHPFVEFRVAALRQERISGEAIRLRFILERRARDAAGLIHLARSAQTWRVRDAGAEHPVVAGVEEEPLLAFPGTGPQMVCY